MLSQDLLIIIMFTTLAGIAMPIGAAIASIETIRPRWLEREFRHAVIAFGGGALLSAVALALVPDAITHVSPLFVAIYFFAGALAFMLLDIYLYRIKTSASQFAAMLSDFIPESIVLGGAFAINKNSAFLLAILIALQNMPEAFNSYRELRKSTSYSSSKIIVIFALTAILGPIAGVTGYLYLSDYATIVSAIMLFASGSILYSVFQDIAPQAKLKKHWAPSMGAVLGFLAGVIGHMLIK